MKKHILLYLLALFIAVPVVLFLTFHDHSSHHKEKEEKPMESTEKIEEIAETNKAEAREEKIHPPIDGWEERITVKPFGIFVTPDNSPVELERYNGFHTGVDFEAHKEEKDKDVAIKAICKGEIIQLNEVSGYGGLIVQSCKIDGEKVTVLYGHVDIESDKTVVKRGDAVKAEEEITILASENSRLNGLERKHLHLGIHRGEGIEYLGYVTDKDRLDEWINIEELLKK